MSTSVWLAVDLGTTHTVAVVGRGSQRPRTLLFDGSPLLPSGVFLDATGNLHTGRDAQRLAATEPDRYEPHPKRRIDDGAVLLGEREVPVSELLATGLRRVAEEAAVSGIRPTDVVLTHPAGWGPVRRSLLERAAAAAGFGSVRMVAEPIAAAYYCTQELEQEIPDGGSVVVFDFGGGTLDVAVVGRGRPGRPAWRVLAVGGLDDLGGLDVDHLLVAHLIRVVAARDPERGHRLIEPSGSADRRDRRAFWTEVRAAKEMLSRSATAPVAVPGEDAIHLHLTRDELTNLADPLIARAVDETRRTLERVDAEPSALLLVGGASRMPNVTTRLHTRLGIAPTVPEQPELPVAYGALLYGMAEPDPVPEAEAPAQVRPVMYAPYPVPDLAADRRPSPPPTVPSPPLEGSGAPAASGGEPEAEPPLKTPVGTPPEAPSSPSTEGSSTRPRGARRRSIAVLTLPLVIALVAVLLVVYRSNDWGGLSDDIGPGIGDAVEGGLDGEIGEQADVEETALRLLHERALDGGAAATVAATGELVVIAEVIGRETVLTALTAEGDPVWMSTHALEPTELHLTPVGELLLVDAMNSATDDGEHMRAAVSLADGSPLWKRAWSDRLDVAYYGTELLVEQRDGIYDNAVLGIDLATGEELWSRAGPDGLYIIDDERIRADTHWDEGEAEEGSGLVPPDSWSLYDNLTAGTRIVDLAPREGTAVIRDAADGEAVTEGDLPLDAAIWTAFEGLAIGRLSDEASPGRDVLAAYALDDLGEAWELSFDAGHRVRHVKPCGPRLVCVAVDHSGDTDLYRAVAVDIDTGEQAWSIPVDWASDDHWYTAPGGLVFGDRPFDTVRTARLLDFEGGTVLEVGDASVQVCAVRDGLAASAALVHKDGTGFHELSVTDIATGERTGGHDIGPDAPEHVVLAGDTVVVLTPGRTVMVFEASALR